MKKKHPRHAAACTVTLLLGTVVAADSPGATRDQHPRSTGAAAQAGASQNERRVPDRLRKVLVEDLMVKESQVTYAARFLEDLGFDSLKAVECVAALEERFQIDIPDEEAEKFLRVGDVVEYLRQRKLID